MAKPNPSVEELIERAEEILKEQNYFILAYDIIDSKKLGKKKRRIAHKRQHELRDWVNTEFYDKTVPFQWNLLNDPKRGMRLAVGDAGIVALDNPAVIEDIVNKAKSLFVPDLRWAVGESAEDDRIKNIF